MNNLIEAVKCNNSDCVASLLEKNTDPDSSESDGWTPLMESMLRGHDDCTRMLLEAGANVYAKSRCGVSAIKLSGLISKVCADEILPDHVNRLFHAASSGNKEELREFVDQVGNVDSENAFGTTALMLAAKNNQDDCLRGLLKSGSHIDKLDDWGETALMYAARANSDKTLDTLVKAGAQKNLINNQMETPLMIACKANSQTCALTLIQIGVDVNLTASNGHSPLMAAVEFGAARIITALLSAGADVNMANADDETALGML